MRLFDIRGNLVTRNVARYSVNWDGKCRSNIQFKVKQFLKPYWRPYIVFEEFPVFGTQLKVDLLNASLKIAVEVNGDQHTSFNPFFHRGSPANYLRGFKNDERKFLWLKRNGFTLIEIMEDEIPKLSRQFFQDQFGVTL
jgi:hypothetical protein